MARQDQLERMKKLGVEPSFTPDFVHLYGAAYRDQIFGPARAEFMVPTAAAQVFMDTVRAVAERVRG